MERLTRRDGTDVYMLCGDRCYSVANCNLCDVHNVLLDRLAAYEDTGLTPEELVGLRDNEVIPEHWRELFIAECEGRLIVLPCKVGDTVYMIVDGKIYTSEVYHITYSDYYGKVIGTVWTKSGVCAYFDHFGKCAFHTREEAEAALEGKNEHFD